METKKITKAEIKSIVENMRYSPEAEPISKSALIKLMYERQYKGELDDTMKVITVKGKKKLYVYFTC